MKFLSVRDLRGKSAQVWDELSQEREMVITSNGRPIAILVAVGESNLEQSLASIRSARAVDAVTRLQQQSVARKADRLTDAEIETEIDTVRRARKR